MPVIFENLEISDAVIARSEDLKYIFGTDSPEESYRNHIDFYCRSLIAINPDARTIDYYSGNGSSSARIPEQQCRTMLWNAGAVAGVVSAVISHAVTPGTLAEPSAVIRDTILDAAVSSAAQAIKNISCLWQHIS